MTLTELTTLLHRWADAHGGKFPEAILAPTAQCEAWNEESFRRFNIPVLSEYKGVRIVPFDTPSVLFAASPNA